MTFNNIITLVKINELKNEFGELVRNDEKQDVYCGLKSIRTSEILQGQIYGYEPAIVFVMAEPLEYQGQERVIFNDIEYRVIKKYEDMAFNILELTCARVVAEEA